MAAIGFALAALAGAELRGFAHPIVAGGTTLLVGWIWADLARRISSARSVALWLWASVALAILNEWLAVVLTGESAGRGFLLVVTLGLIVWVPALIIVLAVLGAPILWARRQEERGPGGRDKGERLVGLIAALLSVAGLVLSGDAAREPYRAALRDAEGQAAETGRPAPRIEPSQYPPNPVDMGFLYASGLLGVLTAGTAAVLAQRRLRARGPVVGP